MKKKVIYTDQAPDAIGTYSQAIRVADTVYLSGQVPLLPDTMSIVSEDVGMQIEQVFKNLQAVSHAAGGSLSDIVKLNVFLTDLSNFPLVNDIMAKYFAQPYPARVAIGVAALPKDSAIEMDAIMVVGEA